MSFPSLTVPPDIDLARQRIHMIGIGGCGMSGAAAMLLRFGAQVSGSDLLPFDGMSSLVASGAVVSIGHDAAHLRPDCTLVVISAAVPPSNPEWSAACARGLPVIKYAELLGMLVRHRIGMAISGTHGKSTTTALCAYVLRHAGLDPSFIFGARSAQLGGSSAVGNGAHFVVEACEFDRSFLHLNSASAAILNIESDHLDCYGTFDRIVEAFGQFADRVDPDGLLVIPAEDAICGKAASGTRASIQTFGWTDRADWRAVNVASHQGCHSFDATFRGKPVLSTKLSIPGRHNVGNALAAIALCHHAGVPVDAMAEGVAGFQGVERRLTFRGTANGITLVDDYAHHPTEVRVTIEAARRRYEPKRTWVVFQPHQYARTCEFMNEFADSFSQADEVIVSDIYAAREPGADPVRGSRELVSRICDRGGHARYLPSFEAVTKHVMQNAVSGDLVMTMGAGDIWKVANDLVERICGSRGAQRTAVATDVVPTGGTRAISVSAA